MADPVTHSQTFSVSSYNVIVHDLRVLKHIKNSTLEAQTQLLFYR